MTWNTYSELVRTSGDYLRRRNEHGEDATATLEVLHFHLVMAFTYSSQFKLYGACGGRVVGGPFRGMRFPPPRIAECLDDLMPVAGGVFNIASLLLGTYESELHDAIETLLDATAYDVIVDVGCSLGYYAVGFAMRQPSAHVHASDMNIAVHDHVKTLAAINDVASRVSIGGLWEPGDFRKVRGKRALVFCDIEGAELGLLDPEAAPELRECDIVVEMHDVFDPSISAILLSRFGDSHDIRIVENLGARPPVPPEITTLTRHERSALMADLRLGPTPWGIMKAKPAPGDTSA